ncbi:MAG: carbon-nitrogen hydrolase family protein [Pyrinomonadaceae bacterium]
MKIAAYQAPLSATCTDEILALIREQIDACETLGVEILCCPEGALGGLADYSDRPKDFAINVRAGELDAKLARLGSEKVATILGFTEIDDNANLYNSAVVYYKGSVVGIYRKLHPAINRSVYQAGVEMPVFTINGLTFGIVICNDSNFQAPAQVMAAKGAKAIFIPTNNGLPPGKAGPELVAKVRDVDLAMALKHGVYVIRADVVGTAKGLVSHGSSGIIGSDGTILQVAGPAPELLVAECYIRHDSIPLF